MGKVIAFIRMALSKKLCTIQEFKSACQIASTQADLDSDGYVSFREIIFLVLKAIRPYLKY